jgi:hypothetical protein
MKERRMLLGGLVLGLLLAVAIGSGLAQGPEEGVPRSGGVSVEAAVSSKFSYQGVLKEDGTPVNGNRHMIFRLYADEACNSQVGGDIAKPGVAVANGLFSVELEVSQDDFNGQGRWLGIEVGGTAIGCQEILPAPYALSLRPGAVISGTGTTLLVDSADGYGMYVYPAGVDGVHVNSANSVGLYVGSAGFNGLYVNEADYSGAYAHTNNVNDEWGFYTPDKIYAGATLASGGSLMLVAQNGDSRDLEAGDVVAVGGMGAPFAEGDAPVPLVQNANQANRSAAVGVVYRRLTTQEYVEEIEHEGQMTRRSSVQANSSEGPVAPGDYLFIVVLGPAQVKADGSRGSIRPGDLLTASASEGRVMKAEPVVVGDTTFYAPGTILGKAMEPLDGTEDAGLIWVWVALQ